MFSQQYLFTFFGLRILHLAQLSSHSLPATLVDIKFENANVGANRFLIIFKPKNKNKETHYQNFETFLPLPFLFILSPSLIPVKSVSQQMCFVDLLALPEAVVAVLVLDIPTAHPVFDIFTQIYI